MANSDKAGSGERFKAPSANTWNRMVEAADAYAEGRLQRPKADPAQPLPTDLIKVVNNTCGFRRRGEVVKICDKAIHEITEEYKWLCGATTDGRGCFAILKGPAAKGKPVSAQVSGVCLALVVVNNESHNRAALAAGEVVMRSATAGPCGILYKPPGLGEKLCVVVIHESCTTQAATTPAVTDSTNCTGSCQWSWVGGAWSLVSNACSPTTTTGEPTTTTTSSGTSSTTTTTTAEPPDRCGCPTTTTTTTTADHCQCLKPLFCASNEGDCTFTSCSKETNELPDCTTTTSTTTTTTTPCNCNTTTTPSGDGNCVWYRDSSGVLRCANCPPGCLPPPVTLGECDVFVSPPVPPVVTPPPPPCVQGCEGGSIWKCVPGHGWVPEAGSGGYLACSRKCPDTSDGTCFSPPPSIPCEVCGSHYEPCVYLPIGTTTTGEPTTTTTSVYDTACGICYGSTTTSTTTTAQCEGNCRLKWSGSAWIVQKKTCAASCGCLTPGISGELPCHVIEVPCTPTTTTTTSTTTTTTTSPWSCCGPDFASCGVPGATYCVSGTTCPSGLYKCSGGNNFADCAGQCGDTTTTSTTTTTGATEKICCNFGSSGSPNCSCFTVPAGSTCSSQYGVPNCVPDSPFNGNCATCITPTTTTTTSTTTTTAEPTTTTTCEACTGLILGKVYWQCKPGTGLGGISTWQLVYNAGGSSLCPEGWSEPTGPCDTDCQCISCDETTPTS